MRKRKESLYLSRLSRCLGSTSPFFFAFFRVFFFYSRKEKSVSSLANNNVSIRFDSEREIRRESGMRDVLRKKKNTTNNFGHKTISPPKSKKRDDAKTKTKKKRERESVFSPIRKRRVKEFYRGNKTTKEERVGFIKQKREMEMEFKRKGATSSFRVCLFYLIP